MVNVKNILKKDNLISAVGLGVGSIAAEVATSKIAPMIFKSEATAKYAYAIPVIAGLVLGTSTGILRSVGHGMIANGASTLVRSFIPADTKASLGIGSDVMMSGVSPMMGLNSDSYDYTSGDAGEMNY